MPSVAFDTQLFELVSHDHESGDVSGLPNAPLVGTAATIEASTPASGGQWAFATDTLAVYFGSGSVWYQAPFKLVAEPQAPDMGWVQDSSRIGILPPTATALGYITDYRLSNVVLQGNVLTQNGGIRIDVAQDPDTFEIYLRNAWQTIIYDLTTENGDFRHTPLTLPVYIWRGQSVALDLGGRPVIDEYTASMGAYNVPRVIDGGTF